MSEMIDRVARALVERGHIDGGSERLARIAIEAMREPTHEMQEAGYCGCPKEWNHVFPLGVWVHMIDEALK